MKLNFKIKFKAGNVYEEIHPQRDWQLLVCSFLILSAIVMAGNISLYYYYQQDVVVPADSFSNGISIKKTSDVDKMEVFFSQRQSDLASSTRNNLIDPSL